MTPNSETIKSLVHKLTAYFEAGDMEGWLSMRTENLRWNMIGTPAIEGKENIRAFMGSIPSGPAPKLTIGSMIVDGSQVAVTGEMDMPNEQGVPSKYAYCDIHRFEGDKIAEMTTYMVELKPAEAEVQA